MPENREPRPVAVAVAAAIAAHRDWKATLGDAIATGASRLDPLRVGRDDCCELGAWLHGQPGGDPATLACLLAEHARFHQLAARILEMAIAGHTRAATRALDGEYAFVSAELESLLQRLSTGG